MKYLSEYKYYLMTYEDVNFSQDEWDYEEDELENFIEPRDWCIKITNDNIKIIQSYDWGTWRKNYNYTIGGHYSLNRGTHHSDGKETITIDQFIKLMDKYSREIPDDPHRRPPGWLVRR